MTDEKQTLSPAEWKSVGDYLVELSEKVQQAASRTEPIGEPRHEPVRSCELGND
jgi:hypothetical protein